MSPRSPERGVRDPCDGVCLFVAWAAEFWRTRLPRHCPSDTYPPADPNAMDFRERAHDSTSACDLGTLVWGGTPEG
jgi:hypothetical protein